jgi:hypothetical protein
MNQSGQPAPTISGATASAITLAYTSVGFSGATYLGDVLVPIPAGANGGQTYAVTISAINASASGNPVTLAALAGTLTAGYSYTVGDVYPYSSDSAPNFGDGVINTLDLIATLRAVVNLAGYTPATCSDRFDAMDAYPVDTPSGRGGDGVLNTLDLITTLRRATNLDTTRPTRTARGLSCPSASAAASQTAVPESVDREEGRLLFGAPQADSGRTRIPVYLIANVDLALAGLSLGLNCDSCQLTYIAPGSQTPSLVDSELPGTLVLAWLSGWKARAGEQVLLGYVETTTLTGSLRFFGASANAGGSRRAVSISASHLTGAGLVPFTVQNPLQR